MTDTLDTLRAQLEEAHQDAAMLQRLTGAADCVKSLTAEYAQRKIALEKAEDAKAKAAHEAQFSGLRDLRIAEIPSNKSSSVLSSRFLITYTRDAWNMDAQATLPQVVTKTGFAALDSNVLAWIIERHPDKIPASITALAPDDVDAALDRYFLGLRRGYLQG